MRSLLVLALTAAVLAPSAVEAQRTRDRISFGRDYGNRFSLEPYGGAMKDAYDIGADGDTGYLVGFRIGYTLASRTRLIGNFGFSNTENVSDPGALADYYVYDNVWVMTTGGGEFDVVPGRTSAALGLQFGVGWRKLDLEGTVGSPILPAQPDDEFTAYEMLLPSLNVKHRLSDRATIMAGIQDHMFNFLEGTTQHSPALTLGFSFR